jgi:RNA polymerase sigma factor (sigma-70 family)
MASAPLNRLFEQLRRAVRPPAEDASDSRLLERFARQADEAAFASLLGRHGPMVFGVCRRVLGDTPDAEDAFQATFLVLVRKAASLRRREAVGSWLYGVARRTALEARRAAAKRRAKETKAAPPAVATAGPRDDLREVLDQELARLPPKYRAVLVLCDLEGEGRVEAAGRLGCPEGTVASRLARARTLLAGRLTRRGFALSAGLLAAVLAQQTSPACVPAALASATALAAPRSAMGQTATAGLISARVATLTKGVLQAMLLTNLKRATVGLLAVCILLAGAAVSTHVLTAGPAGTGQVKEPGPATPPAPPQGPRSGPALARADNKDQAPGDRPANEKVRVLLKERLAAVRELADRVKELHRRGAASVGAVQQAELRVFKAELEVCDTDKERVGVHDKIVAVFKDIEDHVTQLHKRGAASEGEVLEAKVNRLEAEIGLERARAAAAAPGK